ncbi:MAG: tRNA guanosine(34) transglycosylase Tgt [Chloroflexi bacterium]|nr:tRNA guanosine(34) transglycosylase Tgt [Chloroflexota bacterium]
MTNQEKHFHLIKTDGRARAGELFTTHGTIPTPVFLPVGSQATVKSLAPDDLQAIGIKMVLANTYHLYLRPGVRVIEKLGGLHRFMGWAGAILTDSGGYQIFSLSKLRKLDDEGVTFRSHIDGSEHFITPESAVKLQETIGADVIMVLDECTAIDENFEQVKRAMDRTHYWAERCLKAQQRTDQALYAIVQGGTFPQLRKESAEYLTALDFPGYAIGGLSLGEPKQVTWDIVETTIPFLPADKPRYLMGIGSPEDIVEGVAQGIDMFDCALPTRTARNGALFTKTGRVNITNAGYRLADRPIDAGCDCYTCRTFSAAYVHHLFHARELSAYRLATIHNLTFMHNLMSKLRDAILNGTFGPFKNDFLATFQPTDEDVRLSQKQKWLKARRELGDSLGSP